MGFSGKLDVGPVLGGPVRRLAVEEYVKLPPFADFSFPKPAHVVLELARVDRGLHVDGAIEVETHGSCDRCLEEVTFPLHVEVDEQLDPPRRGKRNEFDLNNVLDGDDLDVADLARQLTTSALPMRVRCDEACEGLVSGEGDDGES
jgi:uncharacterized protein